MTTQLLASFFEGGDSTWPLTAASAAVGISSAAAAVSAFVRTSNRKEQLNEAEELVGDLEAIGKKNREELYDFLELHLGSIDGGNPESSGSVSDISAADLATLDDKAAKYVQQAEIKSNIDEFTTKRANLYLNHLRSAERQNSILRLLSIASIILGLAVVILGVGLALFSALDVGIFTGVCGAVPTIFGSLIFQRADAAEKVANENFAHLNQAVNDSNRLNQSLSIAANLKDEAQREYVFSTIALSLVMQSSTQSGHPEAVYRSALENRPSFS
ncbi:MULTISPECIES: TRADD-N-associated membrane domain-containing protein [Rhodococcus]|uniref:Cyanobacterial TRADD-N associated 2 transmembrane domain-containing protein n=1 Tax=Rhodococcus cerastii TaxID=908616 RepID=A0ABU4D335_9NOCA|nr:MULTISPECIES: hypothetical protein [Rhodococcus]MDV6303724.1 hypothetical protein [Rhodococcus cerastii]MDV8058269.1 hypothetical protein [Rhodococcus sp. IEGM 1343]